jgi:hypothetical protein
LITPYSSKRQQPITFQTNPLGRFGVKGVVGNSIIPPGAWH